MPSTSATEPDATVRVTLLGSFQVAVGSRVIPDVGWRLRRAKSLVKVLALAPRNRLHRDQVLDLLWPEAELEAGLNNLHRTLHAARRVFEPALSPRMPSTFLSVQDDTLVLCPSVPIEVDVEAFTTAAAAARRTHRREAYDTAVALYTGELLPDDQYEDWTAREREELHTLFVALSVELAGLCEAGGDDQAAIVALERVVATEPTQEEAHVRLMHLYNRMGRRYHALRQYQLLRSALRRDLDAQPGPAIQRLYAGILNQHTEADPAITQDSLALGDAAAPDTGEHVDGLPAMSPVSTPTNLPAPSASFVGRQHELHELRTSFRSTRVLTITGVGGGGKTRLALQLAADCQDAFSDGVWFVDVAPLAAGWLVPQALAQVLDVHEEPSQSVVEALARFLVMKRMLVVLDNCEHLVEACARLVEELLPAAPHISFLVTSQRPLGAPGETRWRIPSMTMPDPDYLPPFDQLADFDAIQLFLRQARLSRPGMALTPMNATVIIQICRRLGGIPLAIKLAAARVNVISCDEIAARLDDCLGMVAPSNSDAPTRQQTLRATIDWSHGLLSETERTLFRRLAIFAGGWTLHEAETVCAGGPLAARDVLDLLSELVDKSLVVRNDLADGSARCFLLDTMRQYGSEKLAAAHEIGLVRERHAEAFLRLAEQAEPGLTGPGQAAWLVRLETEHDNLRAALRWAHEPAEVAAAEDKEARRRGSLGIRLAGALWRFWYVRGHLREGQEWLASALAGHEGVAPAEKAARAKALRGKGILAYSQGDPEQAVALYEAALALWRELGDVQGTATVLGNLGMVAHYQGQHEQAAPLYQEALDLSRKLKNKLLIATMLNNLGTMAKEQGEFDRASALVEEGLSLFRELEDTRSAAGLLVNLGELACIRGDYDRVALLCEESLALFRDMHDVQGVINSLENLGMAARGQGALEHAKALFEEALALSRKIGDKWNTAETLNALGGIASAQGAHSRATALCTESLRLNQEVGFKHGVAAALCGLAIAVHGQGNSRRAITLLLDGLTTCREARDTIAAVTCLQELADISCSQGRRERATRLYGAAHALRETKGALMPPEERTRHDRRIAAARVGLGESAFAAAWSAGRNMSLEQAIIEASALANLTNEPDPEAKPARSAAPPNGESASLSRREQEIVALLATRRTNREIAQQLGIAERTADTHVSNILKKLGHATRADVAARVEQHGLP